MNPLKRIATTLGIALAVLVLAGSARAEEDDLGPLLRGALVKVHATTQGFDLDSPWNKWNPRPVQLRGVVVRPGLVLTLAGPLANHRMIELSAANSARRYPASLAHIDYGANLALVKIEDEDLLARTAPIPLGDPVTIDAEFELWQLGGSDLLERNTATVQNVNVRGNGLYLTVKTNLSDGGNGQAALKDGRLVGLVTQTRAMSQEGQVLAVETLRHFLEDYDSGDYRGFGEGGIWTHDLLRDDLRAFYGVPDDAHGLAVSRVNPGRTGYGVLKEGDVILKVAGHDLDDEGMFVHPLHGRLSWTWLFTGTSHPGDEVGATILRGGERMDVKIPIRNWPVEEQRVPSAQPDRQPPYLVIGGMVILELTRNSVARSYAIQRYQQRASWDPPSDRARVVYVSRVLSDEANKGLDEIAAAPLLTVNGKEIGGIRDVVTALESPQNGYHVFEFEGLEKPFVIKAADLEQIDRRIAERYRIPELRYLPPKEEEGKSGDAGEAPADGE